MSITAELNSLDLFANLIQGTNVVTILPKWVSVIIDTFFSLGVREIRTSNIEATSTT